MASTLLAAGFLNPEKLLEQGGLALLIAIVFAETGLFVGFFLPGDSLLFIAGFLSSSARRSAQRCSTGRSHACSTRPTW